MSTRDDDFVTLPPPRTKSQHSLEMLLGQRRSVRDYRGGPIGVSDVGQLLWAAQGITDPEGLRTAPSAGALYPLELYVVAAGVEGLTTGIYHYDPGRHRLEWTDGTDQRKALSHAALHQSWIQQAAVVIVFAAVYERTTRKYGRRGLRYVHMEVGHTAENLYLQAEALGLGTAMVGAFEDDDVAAVLKLPSGLKPLALMPVGKK